MEKEKAKDRKKEPKVCGLQRGESRTERKGGGRWVVVWLEGSGGGVGTVGRSGVWGSTT